jgi:RNase P/RNase MRP subunit POP5
MSDVNLTLEVELLKARNNELELKLKQEQSLKIALRNKLRGLLGIIMKNNKNKCLICFENDISRCCVPCGHTYCNKCIANTNTCHMCRTYIEQTINIYI